MVSKRRTEALAAMLWAPAASPKVIMASRIWQALILRVILVCRERLCRFRDGILLEVESIVEIIV